MLALVSPPLDTASQALFAALFLACAVSLFLRSKRRPHANDDDRMKNAYLRRAAYVWLVGGLMWFVLEALAALAVPGYSYARNYISDLGNPAPSPRAAIMNFDFIAHGSFFLIGAIFAAVGARTGATRFLFVALVALNALGSTIVAIVHSSAPVMHGAAPLHGLGALVAIVGGDLAIVVAGASARVVGASPRYRLASLLIGVLGIASFFILASAGGTLVYLGGWERASVYAIMLWEIMTALVILRR